MYYSKDFSNLEIDVDIDGKFEHARYVYIAPLGKIKINEIDFYGGIQTDIFGWKSKTDKSVIKYSSGGIFSRWSRDGSVLDDSSVAGFQGSIYEIANYEGSFASVRNQFKLVAGRYRYRVKIIQEGDLFWAESSVTDPKNKTYKIGLIALGNVKPTISGNVASFFEVYGKNFYIPNGASLRFYRPTVDGIPCDSKPTYSSPKYNGINYSTKITKKMTAISFEVIYNDQD